MKYEIKVINPHVAPGKGDAWKYAVYADGTFIGNCDRLRKGRRIIRKHRRKDRVKRDSVVYTEWR